MCRRSAVALFTAWVISQRGDFQINEKEITRWLKRRPNDRQTKLIEALDGGNG